MININLAMKRWLCSASQHGIKRVKTYQST